MMKTIEPAATDITAFVGRAEHGPVNTVTPIHSVGEFAQTFGGVTAGHGLALVIGNFFANGGQRARVVRIAEDAPGEDFTTAILAGLHALDEAGSFNLLVIPPCGPVAPVTGDAYYTVVAPAAAALCERQRAMFLLDPPADWADVAAAREGIGLLDALCSANAALYFPRLLKPNPTTGVTEAYAPSGAVAGVIARMDATRGVWKAPAGLEAVLNGVTGLTVDISARDNERLNALGINCLRTLRGKPVIWGARTLRGDDRLGDEWKYLPVRRTALFIEKSIAAGTRWVVFEPNDEPLWAEVRRGVEDFLFGLFRQGALQGVRPDEAYFVRCDRSTMTQDDLDRGALNILVGFAPLKPGEFVIVRIRQLTADAG